MWETLAAVGVGWALSRASVYLDARAGRDEAGERRLREVQRAAAMIFEELQAAKVACENGRTMPTNTWNQYREFLAGDPDYFDQWLDCSIAYQFVDEKNHGEHGDDEVQSAIDSGMTAAAAIVRGDVQSGGDAPGKERLRWLRRLIGGSGQGSDGEPPASESGDTAR